MNKEDFENYLFSQISNLPNKQQKELLSKIKKEWIPEIEKNYRYLK